MSVPSVPVPQRVGATRFVTIGYTGRKPADLLRIVQRSNGVLADIRFSPRSRVPYWAKSNLATLFGPLYAHVPEFGNRNYKGGPVDIVDFQAGLDSVLRQFHGRTIFLMCVCADPKKCHRANVAASLRACGYDCSEYVDSIQPDDATPLQAALL